MRKGRGVESCSVVAKRHSREGAYAPFAGMIEVGVPLTSKINAEKRHLTV
jgi:hypothetical protein